MEFPFPHPPYKNILPPVPPTPIQIFLKRIEPWHWFHSRSIEERTAFPKNQVPFYKTSEFWGSASLAVTLVLAGVAFGMNGHLTLAKWLLVAAWPFATVACWCALGRLSRRLRFLSSILLSLLLAIALHKSNIVMRTEVHPVLAPQPGTEGNKPASQQPLVGKEMPISPPISRPESPKPKMAKPRHKEIPKTQPQEPATPKVSPNPIRPRIGTGPDAYKDISDEQVGQWAIEEADKIEQMAKQHMGEFMKGPPKATLFRAQEWFFSNDFKDCCAQDVKELRSEILRRLGPPAKDSREEQAWRLVFPEPLMPSRGFISQEDSKIHLGPVIDYAPYLRRLGTKLKQRNVPKLGPLALHFSEAQKDAQIPEFPYEIVVTIETTRELASGYILVKFNGFHNRALCDLEGSKFISESDEINEIGNDELSTVLAKENQVLLRILKIGKIPFLPSKPMHVFAYAKQRFHVSSVMFFDE